MIKVSALCFTLFFCLSAYSQLENNYWYFGSGTDGILFTNAGPQKLTDKLPGVGYAGMSVVTNPLTGALLFYTDGQRIMNNDQVIMANATNLNSNRFGTQCVQCCLVPGTCTKQFYVFSNSAHNPASGHLYYSIADFTNNPLGEVTTKNIPFWDGNSDEGMCLINKPGTNDFWLIANESNSATYYIWPVTAAGIGTPHIQTFSVTGSTTAISFSKAAGKVSATGSGSRALTLLDFDANTGTLSNEVNLGTQYGNFASTRFSPDGSKVYTVRTDTKSLYQYDFSTAAFTDMQTCCDAQDLKIGPDGKMYHIHTPDDAQPISVIDFPDSTAVGDRCHYHNLVFTPAFTVSVKRFPEIVQLPAPPVAITDSVVVVIQNADAEVLNNDYDLYNNALTLDTILMPPHMGTATINGNKINYQLNASKKCSIVRDSLMYRIINSNCSADTAFVIFIHQGSPIQNTDNRSICEGQSYNGHTTAGTYQDTLIAVNGCDSIVTLYLTTLPQPRQIVRKTICEGQRYLGYTSSGTYTDTFALSGSCDSIRTLELTVIPSIHTTIDTAICRGNNYYGYTLTGTYVDTLAGANTCDSIRTLHLTVIDQPRPDLGLDTIMCSGSTFVMTPGEFKTYLWQDGATAHTYTVTQGGVYQVAVANTCGQAYASRWVMEKACNIYFPSGFTPNKDGKNDFFKILTEYPVSSYHLLIYNRWGQKVFDTTDPKKGWDGNTGGKLSDPGSYVWYAEFTKDKTPFKMTGTVVLIR